MNQLHAAPATGPNDAHVVLIRELRQTAQQLEALQAKLADAAADPQLAASLVNHAQEQLLLAAVAAAGHQDETSQAAILDRAEMLDLIGLAVIATDTKGRIVYANRFAEMLYGWRPSELLGMQDLQLRVSESLPEQVEEIFARLQKGEVWTQKILIRQRDGRELPGLMTYSPLLGKGGNLAGKIGVARDIFDYQRVADELGASEERYRATFRNNPLPMWVYDLETLRFVTVNLAAIEEYGYSEAEFLAMTIHGIRPPDELQRLQRSLLEQQDGTRTFGIWKHRLKNGTLIDVEVSSSSIQFGGRAARLVLANDITVRKAAEEKLVQSEALLRISDRTAHLGGWSIELPDRRLAWSDEVWAIREMPKGVEPALEDGLLAYAPEWREVISKALADCFSTGTPFDLEPVLITASNRRKWVQLVGRAMRNSTGAITRVYGVLKDIDDRKSAEQALRQSEQRFRELAENIDEVFYVFDPVAMRTTYVSPAYEKVWGRSCESLYSEPLSYQAAVHPEDRAQAASTFAEHLAGKATDVQYRIVRPDGKVRWIRDHSYVVRGQDGAVARVVGVADDITERRQAGERLREQASLLDKAQDAILVRDLEHRITYWNKSAERLYGWTAEEAIGRAVPELLVEDYNAFQLACEHLTQAGDWVGELHQTGKDAKELTVESHWTLVRDDAGLPTSILSIDTNITERKLMEQQFLRAQRMENIGTLAGGIAHDLNNVLAPIMMSIDLLKMTVTGAEDVELLDIIAGSAKRGADMVGQVLSFARGMDGQRIEVQPQKLIDDIATIIRDTFPKGVKIRTTASPDLWAVLGDPTQLHQVLLNLCVNARDAMPDGGQITIGAENATFDAHYAAMNIDAQPGPYVVIHVEDTGSGIPEAIIDKIFDPFFTTKAIGKGTGLGLSTSAGIIKSHGGFMRVYSEKGQGSSFRIYLPAVTGAASQIAEEAALVMPRGNGETVLVVDDEASIREIARKTLEAFGYRVLLAADGAEAVSVYAQNKSVIAVVIVDMMMPIMDGAATVQVLMKINPAVLVIAASGMAASGSATKALAAGAKHVLAKPYTTATILNLLDKMLHESP